MPLSANMLVTRHLCQALLLGLAIFYGTGECSVFISYINNANCSDVNCFPLRISKVEYLLNNMDLYPLCTTVNSTVETVRTKTEAFFNEQCPTTNAGPAYNKSSIENACRNGRGRISSVRVTYNCSSATATTQTGYVAITSSVKEGTLDSNSTTSGNTNTMTGDAVAAAIATSVGAIVIVFIAVYLWRRKLGKECLSHTKSLDQKVLYPHFATTDITGREERVYENCLTGQTKRPANGTNVAESLGDASRLAKEFDDQSTERNFQDMPCYLELLPSDSCHNCMSQESHSVHPTVSKVQDEKDTDQYYNKYSSTACDITYFVLEKLPDVPSHTDRYKTTSTSETLDGAQAEDRATAQPESFNVTCGNNQVASQDEDLKNTDNEMYVQFDDAAKSDGQRDVRGTP